MYDDIMLDQFDFSTAEGAKVAEESNKGGDFQREIAFLTLKADPASVQQGKDRAILRLVTEYERKPWMDGFGVTPYNFAWITVAQHYAPTKQKPPYAREQAQWPNKWSTVCRNDKIFAKKYNGDCFLCKQGNKTSDRTWALAVEREQVFENGTLLGVRDKMREVLVFDDKGEPVIERVEPDGKKIYAKKWVPGWTVLNFGWKNFFGPLSGNGAWSKTVMDRDYAVIRSGIDTDTSYGFVALDPILMDGQNPWGLDAGTKYDMGLIVGQDSTNGRPIPLSEAVYPEMPDLRRIISERTTDDYYGRWFVPGWLPEGFDPNKAQQGSGGSQPPQQGYMPTGGYQPGVQAGNPAGSQPGFQGGYQPGGQGYQQPQPQQPPAQPQPQNAQGGPTSQQLAGLRDRLNIGQKPQPEQPTEQPQQAQPTEQQPQQTEQPANQ